MGQLSFNGAEKSQTGDEMMSNVAAGIDVLALDLPRRKCVDVLDFLDDTVRREQRMKEISPAARQIHQIGRRTSRRMNRLYQCPLTLALVTKAGYIGQCNCLFKKEG
jgi:hypothetical protein